MSRKQILFISGPIGLGHAIRDITIARELRSRNPELDILWLAAEPAASLIRDAGETLLPESAEYVGDQFIAEGEPRGFELNLFKFLLKSRKGWKANAEVFKKLIQRCSFDLIIADKAYDTALTFKDNPGLKRCPFVMIYDFVGLDASTRDPMEKLGIYNLNLAWFELNQASEVEDLSLFVGEPEDIPDKPFGLLLTNRRSHATKHYTFIGHILSFNPAEYSDAASLKERLGYGKDPLIMATIGGTAIGAYLLNLCAGAYPLIKKEIPNLRMVLICGPRIKPEAVKASEGVEVKGFVPRLYEHLAACDLAVVQGSGSTTLELTALKKPFLYFPLEGHSEQEIAVAARLLRLGAGVKMSFSQTTEASLARAILDTIRKDVSYPSIPIDGAVRAADLIMPLL